MERLAADLRKEFPGVAGFSAQNLWFMRAFCLAWTDQVRILSQPVRELADTNLQQAVGELDGRNLPQAVAQIPWGHNIQLITKVKDPAERLWYARQAIEHGWSRAVLVHWIESDLYSRQGKAVTNFPTTLPAPQSDLAAEVIKDPYNFDFLTLGPDAACGPTLGRTLRPLVRGQWYKLAFEVRGEQLRAYLYDELVVETADARLSQGPLWSALQSPLSCSTISACGGCRNIETIPPRCQRVPARAAVARK